MMNLIYSIENIIIPKNKLSFKRQIEVYIFKCRCLILYFYVCFGVKTCLTEIINFSNMQCIDFRNSRYEGETVGGLPNGIGIAIDHNHLFCLAKWNKGQIDGPVFIIYPDCKILCGYISGNQLSGLCCFYLANKIKTYVNYQDPTSQQQQFMTILPAYKLILQVSCFKGKAKVNRHQNYNQEGMPQSWHLMRVLGQNQNLQQFGSWKMFLIMNFINPHKDKIFMNQNGFIKFNQYFIGLKGEGLGIKLLDFQDKDVRKNDKSSVLVSAIGRFIHNQELIGYGQKLVDFSVYRKVEEGQYLWKDKQTVQYIRTNRPRQALRLYNKFLLKSMYFRNHMLNISFLQQLQKIYTEIDVQIVEETQKIAQIVLHDGGGNVVLAEIQNKRQKKRTPVKRQKEQLMLLPQTLISYNMKDQQKYFGEKSPKIVQNKTNQARLQEQVPKLVNPEMKLSGVRNSIYSSVSKLKKSQKERRDSATKGYRKIFVDEQIPTKQDRVIQRSLFKQIRQSPPPKNGITAQRFKYDFESIGTKRGNNHFSGNVNSYKSKKGAQPLYLVEKRLASRSPTSVGTQLYKQRDKPSTNFKYVYEPLTEDHMRHKYRQNKVNKKEQTLYSTKSPIKPKQQNTTLFNRFIQDDSISQQYLKLKQKEEQVGYFNSLIKIQGQCFQNQSPTFSHNQSESTLINGLQRRFQKTPGKIKTIPKKTVYISYH